MKKLLFSLLLISSLSNAQALFDKGVKITGGITTDNSATKVVVQSANNVLNTISKTELQDAFYFATASALPVVGITDKLYITRDDNKLYRFNGTIYVPLSADVSGKEDIANKQNSLAVDATDLKYPTVTAVNAGLATKQNTISGTTNVFPKFGAGGLVNSTISEDANGVLIQGNYVGANIAPLVVKNNTPYGAPFTQMIALFQNSAGVNMFQLRADGFSTFQSFASMASLSIRDLGTAATASIRLGNVNGTGLFSPSANAIGFTAGGTEAGRIHTSRRWSINSTTDDGINQLQVNGTIKASPAVTSDQLATLGQVNSSAILLTGNQTATGRKLFNSDNTTLGGITVSNSKTTGGSDAYGLAVFNTGSAGIYTENTGTGSTGDALRIANSSNTGNGLSIGNFSSGTALLLRTQPGATGDLLNAEVGVTRIQSTGRLSTTLAPVSGNDVVNKTYVDTKGDAKSARFELSSDVNLPISTAGSVSVVDFDSSVFNNDTVLFTNNGSGVITCNRAGIYLVTTSVVLESPLATALTRTDIGIRKNGTTIVAATTNDSTLALGNNVRSMTTTTIINLAANDTIAAVVNLFGADATGRAIRLPALFGTTATQVSNISIQKLEL